MDINDNVQWVDDDGITRTGVLKQFITKMFQVREQLRTIAPLYRTDILAIVLSGDTYYEVYFSKLRLM